MFRKTDTTPQLDLFRTPSNLMRKREAKKYDDPTAWHNQFFHLVTSKIEESAFSSLYKEGNMGAPNASIRTLVAMSILKEGFGCSDEDLFEKCQFDLLTRKALGLLSLDDPTPSLDTYYLLRRRICEYEDKTGENLMGQCFQQITGDQIRQFKISGKSIRMDSKLIGSNIAWQSRYEIIHSTFRRFMEDGGVFNRLNPSLREAVGNILQVDAKKTVYHSDSEAMGKCIASVGQVIYRVLVRLKADESCLLHRVFHEQYIVESGVAIPRDKKEISAKSVQNPNDPDADYRKKGDQQIKGYSCNITETTDEKEKPGLITDVQVKPATAADNSYLIDAVLSSEEVTTSKVESVYADGAYQSNDNRTFAQKNNIELFITGIQGRRSRFELERQENFLVVTDRQTGEVITAQKTKSGKYRIPVEGKNKYRYFTDDQIEMSALRRDLDAIPIEKEKIRNNVEATIFQYCFHTRNNKTRYRGLIKHKLHAYARCLWVNCMRLIIFRTTECKRTLSGDFSTLFWSIERHIGKIIPNSDSRIFYRLLFLPLRYQITRSTGFIQNNLITI